MTLVILRFALYNKQGAGKICLPMQIILYSWEMVT